MTTTIEPILLNVDLSVEEYDLGVDDGSSLDMDMDTAVNVTTLSGGSLPTGGVLGDIVIKRSSEDFDCEWVAPATSAEQDNTRPITSAAVYTEIGNINALLATI